MDETGLKLHELKQEVIRAVVLERHNMILFKMQMLQVMYCNYLVSVTVTLQSPLPILLSFLETITKKATVTEAVM